MSIPVSILILTKNEEQNLPGCLASVSWSDDIHVYDSLSTDQTIAIAQAAGAKVTQRQFDNWATHQNWGLQNIPFKYAWVFYIDADELVTFELSIHIEKVIKNPGENVAFRVQRRDFFMGHWLKHAQASPFYIRLFRPEKMRYERLVNPVSRVDGPVGKIAGFLDHYPFNKGITHWLERHNSYSSFEAQQIITDHLNEQSVKLYQAFFSTDFHERRFHQKALFYRLPMRPIIKFLLLYILKGGFLDKKAGLTYALLQSFYEYMIVLKTRELLQQNQEKTVVTTANN